MDNNETDILCFECGQAFLTKVEEDYVFTKPDGDKLTVPLLEFLRCGKCGGECFPPEAGRRIDKIRFPNESQE